MSLITLVGLTQEDKVQLQMAVRHNSTDPNCFSYYCSQSPLQLLVSLPAFQ